MKKTIITIVNILAFQLIMVGCTSPLFLASFPSRNSFPLGSYSYYENIVTFEVVADSQYIEVKVIEVFKLNHKFEIKYFASYDVSFDKGDIFTVYYNHSDIENREGVSGDFLIIDICTNSYTRQKLLQYSSDGGKNFKKNIKLLRTFRDTKIGDVDLILEDGSRLLGQLKNGQPIGIWRLFYPEKEYKNLMVYQVNFDTGLGEFYIPSKNGRVERTSFKFNSTNIDKKENL